MFDDYTRLLQVRAYLLLHSRPDSETFIYENNENLSKTTISANKRISVMSLMSLRFTQNTKEKKKEIEYRTQTPKNSSLRPDDFLFEIAEFIAAIRRFCVKHGNESFQLLHVLSTSVCACATEKFTIHIHRMPNLQRTMERFLLFASIVHRVLCTRSH